MIREQHIDPQEIAILFRKNAHSRLFEQAMVRHGIPFKLYGLNPFYARKEVKDVLSYLRLVYDVRNNQAFLRAIESRPRGVGPKKIEQIEDYAKKHKVSLFESASLSGDENSRQFCRMIEWFREQYFASKTIQLHDLMKLIIQRSEIVQYYVKKEKEKGEVRAENIKELFNATMDYHHRYHLGETDFNGDGASSEQHEILAGFLSETVMDADRLSRNGNKRCVQMLTLHRAKGLEYHVVFIPAMEMGEFPTKPALIERNIEEERRLFYVGITRAKMNLYLSCVEFRQRICDPKDPSGKPSIFLREIPHNLYQHETPPLTSLFRLSGAKKAPHSEPKMIGHSPAPSKISHASSPQSDDESESDAFLGEVLVPSDDIW